MTDPNQLSADDLRAMGIDHELLADDDDLIATVALLLDIGLELEDMVGQELTWLAAPRLLRPDATIDPAIGFAEHRDAAFRAKGALALGFNLDDADTQLLTPQEIETVHFFQTLRPILGDEDLLALMRVMGSSMGRLARSVISALRLHYETPILEETGSIVEVARAYRDLIDDMLPSFLDASTTVLRQHLSVATGIPHVWNVDRSHSATMERITVGFVDLVGFTSFTERANLEQFVVALTAFEAQAQEVIVGNGGTLIKLIGDEAMFVAPTPASGVEISRRLAKLSLSESGPAAVRIGLASGEAVAVGGDYYGTVVNIAARAVQEGEPDAIVVTEVVAAGAHASARFKPLGARELRGISEPVQLFQLL